MKIDELYQKADIDKNVELKQTYLQFEKLLFELRKRKLLDKVVISVNKEIGELNSTAIAVDDMRKIIKKTQTRIINLLEKEVKLVPKNYYRNLWLVIGMPAFGLPIGVAIGSILGNMAFLGIGLPIGLAIGIAIGSLMDKKAFEEGRQLDVEIKY